MPQSKCASIDNPIYYLSIEIVLSKVFITGAMIRSHLYLIYKMHRSYYLLHQRCLVPDLRLICKR